MSKESTTTRPETTPCPIWCVYRDGDQDHEIREHATDDRRLAVRDQERPVFDEYGAIFGSVEVQGGLDHHDDDAEPYIDLTVRKPLGGDAESSAIGWLALSLREAADALTELANTLEGGGGPGGGPQGGAS